jgi:hypothetical protein
MPPNTNFSGFLTVSHENQNFLQKKKKKVPCHVAISSHPFQLKTPLLGLKNTTFLTQNHHFSYQKASKSVFLAIFDRFPQNQIFLQKKKKNPMPCHTIFQLKTPQFKVKNTTFLSQNHRFSYQNPQFWPILAIFERVTATFTHLVRVFALAQRVPKVARLHGDPRIGVLRARVHHVGDDAVNVRRQVLGGHLEYRHLGTQRVAVAGWQWYQSKEESKAVILISVTMWQWQYWQRYD